MVSRFGSLKVNIGANIVIIIAHTLYTISQALSHLAPVAMPTISVVAMGIFLVGLVAMNVLQFLLHLFFSNYTMSAKIKFYHWSSKYLFVLGLHCYLLNNYNYTVVICYFLVVKYINWLHAMCNGKEGFLVPWIMKISAKKLYTNV